MTPNPKKPPFDPAALWKRLVQSGYSREQAKTTVDEHIRRARLAMDSGKSDDMDAVSFATTVMMGFGEGASAKFADELAGVAAASGARGAVKPKTAYYAARDEHRAMLARATAQHPVARFIGEAAGTIATLPLVAAALGVRGAQLLPSSWRAAAEGLKAGATQGAIQGAVIGTGNADELADVPREATVGAVSGAVLGGVVGAASRGMGNRAGIRELKTAGEMAEARTRITNEITASSRQRTQLMREQQLASRMAHPERQASQQAAHEAIQMKPKIAQRQLSILERRDEGLRLRNEELTAKLGQSRLALAEYLSKAPTEQLQVQLQFAQQNPGLIPEAILRAARTEVARRSGIPQAAPGSTPFLTPGQP